MWGPLASHQFTRRSRLEATTRSLQQLMVKIYELTCLHTLHQTLPVGHARYHAVQLSDVIPWLLLIERKQNVIPKREVVYRCKSQLDAHWLIHCGVGIRWLICIQSIDPPHMCYNGRTPAWSCSLQLAEYPHSGFCSAAGSSKDCSRLFKWSTMMLSAAMAHKGWVLLPSNATNYFIFRFTQGQDDCLLFPYCSVSGSPSCTLWFLHQIPPHLISNYTFMFYLWAVHLSTIFIWTTIYADCLLRYAD